MGKWLAIGFVAIAAALVLLWLEMRAPAAAPTVTANVEPAAAPAPTTPAFEQDKQKLAELVAVKAGPKKIETDSDEFFERFDDVQPQILTRSAAKCYTGGLHRVHRNQKVKLGFKNVIKDGKVFVTDVVVLESTINDDKLVECFRREVANTKWEDPELPDWEAPDELVIRPERGMKKHMPESLEYLP